MWAAAKDHLVIKSATRYGIKLAAQKLINTTIKRNLHECANVAHKNASFLNSLPSNDGHKLLLANYALLKHRKIRTQTQL